MSEQTVTLNITGMNCNGCRSAVERSLKLLDGVQVVSVSLDQAEARVTFNPQQVAIDDLTERVVDAGYGVGMVHAEN